MQKRVAMMMANTMRSVVLLATLFLTSLTSLWAQRSISPQMDDEFAVQVMPDATQNTFSRSSHMDLGAVSADRIDAKRRGSQRSATYSITRRVRLKVSHKNGRGGRAVVQAYLLHDCYPCRMKFDGVEIGPSPTVVMNGIELNSVSDHRIEIEIPISMPAGAIDAEIGWQVDEQ